MSDAVILTTPRASRGSATSSAACDEHTRNEVVDGLSDEIAGERDHALLISRIRAVVVAVIHSKHDTKRRGLYPHEPQALCLDKFYD